MRNRRRVQPRHARTKRVGRDARGVGLARIDIHRNAAARARLPDRWLQLHRAGSSTIRAGQLAHQVVDARQSCGGQVAYCLVHERDKGRLQRKVVPFVVQVRREDEHPSGRDLLVDQSGRAVRVPRNHLCRRSGIELRRALEGDVAQRPDASEQPEHGMSRVRRRKPQPGRGRPRAYRQRDDSIERFAQHQ